MTTVRYPRYRHTGLDWSPEAPEHWRTKRLRFVLAPRSQRLSATLTPESEVSFIPMEAVGEHGELRLTDTRPLADIGSGYTCFADGDVVVAKITPCFENGKGALASGLTNGIAFGTTELHVLRAAPGELDRKFLYYLTASLPFRKLGEASMYGAGGQKRVPEEFIKDFRVAIPPTDEQCTIVTFLDHETKRVDALIEKRRRMIALLTEKRSAVIANAVTQGLNSDFAAKNSGIDWLPRIPAHWEMMALGKVTTKLTNGYVGPTRDLFVDAGVPYLQSLHIKDNSIRFGDDYFVPPAWSAKHKKSILKADDVLIVQTGDIGQVAFVGEAWAGANCHALIICSPDRQRIDGRFLSWVFTSRYGQARFEALKTGALHPHLNCGNIKHMPIPIPPLQEQLEIADHIASETQLMRRTGDKLKRAIDLLSEYRNSLITAAVTGQINVQRVSPHQ